MAVSKPGWQLAGRNEISEKAWNALLDNSPDYALFSRLWFLDAVGESSVYAAVYGNYETAVPLLVAKKGFLRLALAPLWIPYSGVLGNRPSAEIWNRLKNFLKLHFAVYALPLAPETWYGSVQYARPTYILDLPTYSQPEKHHLRQIQKAVRSGVNVREKGDAEAFTEFYWNTRGHKAPGFKPYHRERLLCLTREALMRGYGFCIEATNGRDETVAAAFFLRSSSTAYFLDGTANEMGRSSGAMFRLIHEGLLQLKEKGVIRVDFCGSKDPGVARFYKGFGAEKADVPLLAGGWLWFFLPVQLRERFL